MILFATLLQWVGFLVGLAGIGAGVALVWREVRRAPEAEEDRSGWRSSPRPGHAHFTRHKINP